MDKLWTNFGQILDNIWTKLGQNLKVDKCWTNYLRDSSDSMPTFSLDKNWTKIGHGQNFDKN